MPTGLKRYQETKQFHFITFSCYKRQSFLRTATAKDTVQRLLEKNPQAARPMYRRLRHHARAHPSPYRRTRQRHPGHLSSVVEAANLPPAEIPRPKQFWQRRYYDFNVSTHQKHQYIHGNPVKRGLISTPEDYPWSSLAATPPANPTPSRLNPTGPPTPRTNESTTLARESSCCTQARRVYISAPATEYGPDFALLQRRRT